MATKLTALVTGSARRLGMAIARDLIRSGFGVVLHSRNPEAAKLAARELGDGVVGIVVVDLSTPGGPTRVVQEALKLTAGHLTLLVNNAGAFTHRPAIRTLVEDWDLEMDLCARAAFFSSVEAHPVLKATGGMIINISDYGAVDYWPNYAAHSVAKAALEATTLTLAKSWEDEVRVNCICPPTVTFSDDIIGGEPVGPGGPLGHDPRGTVPASAVTSILLELYMQGATSRIIRLGQDLAPA